MSDPIPALRHLRMPAVSIVSVLCLGFAVLAWIPEPIASAAGDQPDSAYSQLRHLTGEDAAPMPVMPLTGVSAAVAQSQKIPPARLTAEDFTVDELKQLIGSTSAGRNLLKRFDENGVAMPEILPSDELTKEQKELLRRNGHPVERSIAMFVPRGVAGNEREMVVYKSSQCPVFAVAYLTSHELQHALDAETRWWKLIQARLEQIQKRLDSAYASGGMGIEDLEAEELGYGLREVRKYFTELNAFSRGAAVRRELEGANPALIGHWARFKRRHGIGLDFDPAGNPGDREKLRQAYIWAGNDTRFKKGLQYIRQDKSISRALRQAGVGGDQRI